MEKKNYDEKVIFRILLCIYLVILIRLIVLKYPLPVLRGILDEWELSTAKSGVATANLRPLRSIRMYIRYYDRINGFDNLFGNVMVFMPFGFLIPMSFPQISHIWQILLHSFWFSLCIELFQLVSHFGAFDVDDILLNTLGGLLGFGVLAAVRAFCGRDVRGKDVPER